MITNKKNLLLLFILIFGSILRLYNFINTINLETDQALAFLIADRIINTKHILLTGPITSLYWINILPPTYYYFITLLYFLFRNVIIVSLIFCFIGIFSIIIFFLFIKEVIDIKTALIGSFLYALSFKMIGYSRNIWEPHSVPFFILLAYYFMFIAYKKKRILFLIIANLIFIISLMYISSFLLIPSFLILNFFFINQFKENKFKIITLCVISFFLPLIFSYFPVWYYEYTHDYYSWKKIFELFGGQTEAFRPINIYPFIISFRNHLILMGANLFFFRNSIFNLLTSFLIILFYLVSSFFYVTKLTKRPKYKNCFLFIVFPTISGIILTSFYHNKPYFQRLASIFPFFLFSFAFALTRAYDFLINQKSFRKVFVIIPLFSVYFYMNRNVLLVKQFFFQKLPLYSYQMSVAKYINESVKNNSFSIYVIAPYDRSNYYSVEYWYALETIKKARLVKLNAEGNFIDKSINTNSTYIFLLCKNFDKQYEEYKECVDFFKKKFTLSNYVSCKKIDNVNIYTFKSVK